MKELEFSRKVRQALRREGFLVQPIETGGTGSGVPDLFVCGHGVACFLEMKSFPSLSLRKAAQSSIEGPGQKAFLTCFCKGTMVRGGACEVVRHSFLMCSCADGAALFRYGLKDKETVLMWLGKEGSFKGDELAAAVQAFHVSCVPSKSLQGLNRRNLQEHAVREYRALTGVEVPFPSLEGAPLERIYKEEEALEMAFGVCKAAMSVLIGGKG